MIPLSHQLKPKSFNDFVGQEHLIGENRPITNLIKNKHLFSLLFWGPSGVGKTTLANLIFNEFSDLPKFFLSAVEAGKNDLKKIIKENEETTCLIFLDEIHRFSKLQQDYLLPFVESGQIILIGATTENPSHSVNNALLSRMRVFLLKPLNEKNLEKVIEKTTKYLKIKIDKDANDFLINYSENDARKLINLIEHTYYSFNNLELKSLKDSLQSVLNYDKKGDYHYHTISAFIKSMRAGKIDATLYYLASMIKSGEDPKFIARRMVVFASEDVGLAQPTALVIANEVFDAVEKIGLPECQLNLAFGATYLARCQKSRQTCDAFFKAMNDIEIYKQLDIPLYLRNSTSSLEKELDYGKNYQMYDKSKSFLPEKIKTHQYFIKK
jgi:putative ATPase